MILQSLTELYRRKLALNEIAPPGFEKKELHFLIVINKSGEFSHIEDLRDAKGKGRAFLLPAGVVRTMQIIPNTLWDNTAYVLGLGDKRPKEKHEAFVQKSQQLLQSLNDVGAECLCTFLAGMPNRSLLADPLYGELAECTGNISFRLSGDPELILERAAVRGAISKAHASDPSATKSICLVSGEFDEIERIHPPIKGLMNGQPSGTALVSFNLDAFRSHEKEQGANAPVGKHAAFAYTTALNALLARDSRQKLLFSDTTFVFWAKQKDVIEDAIADLFGTPLEDDPARRTEAIRAIYTAAESGSRPTEGLDEFYMLGLAANASRTVVRFWAVSTTSEIAINIKSYFEDLALERSERMPEFPSISYFLDALAPNGDRKRLAPQLAASLLKAALGKARVDNLIVQGVVQRLKSDHKQWNYWLYARCCLLKAYLLRTTETQASQTGRIKMSLDMENENSAYRLGRLFAVLERTQELASPGLNSTIRERFYGAASTTPVTVFPRLLKLKNHHVAKLKSKVWTEKLIGEILEPIKTIPSHLNLGEQAQFAIGYYHQRQAFYQKSSDTEVAEIGEVQCQM